jgi:hypothetical protein
LLARLREQDYLADARVKLAVKSLSNQEITLLSQLAELSEKQAYGWDVAGTIYSFLEIAIMRLLDKRLISLVGTSEKGIANYQLTQLGRLVAGIVKSGLPWLRGANMPEKVIGDDRPQNENANQA